MNRRRKSVKNAAKKLFHRELGDFSNPYRFNVGIWRSLVCSESRDFVLTSGCSGSGSLGSTWITQGDLFYGDKKLYVRNNATKNYDCYSLLSRKSSRRVVYSLPSRPKWEDQEIVAGPLTAGQIPPLAYGAHRDSLFVLRLNNVLVRYDLQTGVRLQTIFLSDFNSASGVRFKEISFDGETGILALKSIRSGSGSGGNGGGGRNGGIDSCPGAPLSCRLQKDVLLNFIVFDYPPMNFRAHFEIRRSVFGKNVVDAAINQGFLILMHSDDIIKLYSLKYILQEFLVRDYKLNERIISDERTLINEEEEEEEDFIVGQSPGGLPLNLQINHCPPCLLEVRSHHHHLQIGAFPWRYIVCKQEGQFQVEDLLSREGLENGKITSTDRMEPDQLLFHPDDSPRILHVGNSQLEVLDIEATSLRTSFLFRPHEDRDKHPLPPATMTSSSGRRIIRPSTFTDFSEEEPKPDLSFDFEDELEILVVLYALEYVPDDEDDFLRTRLEKVIFFDGASHKVLRVIQVGQEIRQGNDVCSIHVTLDRDILLIRVKSSVKSTAFVYRLSERLDKNDEDKDENFFRNEKETEIQRFQRKRQRRMNLRRNRRRQRADEARTLRRRSTWNEPFEEEHYSAYEEEDEDDDVDEEEEEEGNGDNRSGIRSRNRSSSNV